MEQRVKYHDVVQGSDEWRATRVGVVTGSVVGAILGHSPFKSRAAALKTMVQEANGYFKDLNHVPAIRWGNEKEPVAAGYYDLYEGLAPIEKAGFFTLNEWLGASPDRLVGNDGLLEIKCPYSLRDDEMPDFLSIDVQEHYYDQIQMQMMVTGRQWTDFFQWTPADYMCERVPYDRGWWKQHEKTITEFYQDYLEALDDPAQYLDDDQKLPAFEDEHMEFLAKQYALLKPQYDDIKAQFEEVERAIRDRVTQSSQGYGICVRTSPSKGQIDYKKALTTILPDVKDDELEEFRRAASTRKFIRFIE